jgi:uncharacterized protein (DUF1697 family)
MTKYVALLRAVNVGGTGKLPMAELKSMCSDAGFARVETYIASGNVVFETRARPSRVKAELEARLLAFFAKPVGVVVRTAAEMVAVLKANPFPEAEPKFTYAIFLDERPHSMPWITLLAKVVKGWPSAIGRFSFTTARAWAAPNSVFRRPERALRAT